MITIKGILLSAIMLMAAVSAAYAQPVAFAESTPSQSGAIGLSSSAYRSWCCNAYDEQPGLLKLYVYHVYTPGATASQFMVSPAYIPNLTYLGETSPFDVVIGNSKTGIAISYGACLTAPILLLEIWYFGIGLSEPCSIVSVQPSPSAPSGNIEVADCSVPPNVLFATGADLVINPDPFCSWWECFCDPDPVEQRSWGQIKSLYRGE
ncbi:MAG: hypothetical protein ABIA59_01835 [Candidatus Latescibacterota bacterium]